MNSEHTIQTSTTTVTGAPAGGLASRITSFERSAIAGISLLLAASFALQSMVIAHGAVVGQKMGEAKAALSPAALKLKPVMASIAVEPRPIVSPELAPGLARLSLIAKRMAAQSRVAAAGSSAQPSDRTSDVAVAPATSETEPKLALRDDTFGPEMGKKPRLRLASIGSLVGAIKPDRPVADAEQAVLLVRPGDRNLSQRSAPAIAGAGRRGAARALAPVEKVHFQAHTPERCLPTDLLGVIYDVAEKFGEVQILSTFRDQERNRRVGGADRSYHLSCQAIDFRVSGRQGGLLAYLEGRPEVGGLKRYPMGYFHIDNGPRRSW